MSLYWCQIRNFGDELNTFFWPRLAPDLVNDNNVVLFGIGTILMEGMSLDRTVQKCVFSSGVGYGKAPVVLDPSWKIYCVRGPLSADALGIERKYAITDGAVLIRRYVRISRSLRVFRFGLCPTWIPWSAREMPGKMSVPGM